MKKKLKIIFLDFNGSIDTPFKRPEYVGYRGYTPVEKDVMTELDYEKLFANTGDGGREPEQLSVELNEADLHDHDTQAYMAQEQMMLRMRQEESNPEAWLAEKEMRAKLEKEADDERRAIIEESRGKRVGDPVADPETWVEPGAIKEEEPDGYIEVKKPELFKEGGNIVYLYGYDNQGYDPEGYDRYGFKRDGYDKFGFDAFGYNRFGFDREGLDVDGYNSFGVKYTPYSPSVAGIESLRDNKWDKHRNEGHKITRTYSPMPIYRDEANPECVKYLKALADETGAKIVYSTTRRFGGWEACSRYLGLPAEYSLGGEFGVTPLRVEREKISAIEWFRRKFKKKAEPAVVECSWKPRQREIKAWLDNWKGEEEIENYLIIDDDPITDSEMKKHWIPTVADNRFLKDEYEQALSILTGKI